MAKEKKKMGRPKKGEGRPFDLGNVRLWEIAHNKLQSLIDAGGGKVSKSDIINWAILSFDEAELRLQAALETISDNEHEEQE